MSYASLSGQFKSAGFVFKKSLGQNFIFEENYLDGIAAGLGLSKDDTVVEVGTGAGTLTRVLARRVRRVISFEVDRRLENILREQFAEYKNIKLIFKDFLKVSESELSELTEGKFKAVANIPYYITSPLLLKFSKLNNCEEMCFLVQEELARRIAAKHGGKDYGALSVTLQAVADCKIINNVPRRMFVPIPEVDSCFVKIKKTAAVGGVFPGATGEQFEKLVKGIFAARRKTVLNALRQVLGTDSETARNILVKAGIDETFRPEQISVSQFVKLSQII